jgi:hypothetical protein
MNLILRKNLREEGHGRYFELHGGVGRKRLRTSDLYTLF